MLELKPIHDITDSLEIPRKFVIPYGAHAAKVDVCLLDDLERAPEGKLVLVTSMTPTGSGEGKTTLAIGLAQALSSIGKRAIAAIRQPSLGPLFGAKGGATGGGLSSVQPKDFISMQFTGDDSAVAASHNLIAAMTDNHVYHGNSPPLRRVVWTRASEMSDRALRSIKINAGTGLERESEFHISAASEVMSILSLAVGLPEIKKRLSAAIVGFDESGAPVSASDVKASGAAASLLRLACHPNVVQSTEGTPVFIHAGPFGNVSIGCSSLAATKLALRLADYVVTEAGFSTELGAEKFFNIMCRTGNVRPSAAVIVATIDAVKTHGIENLAKHCSIVDKFGVPAAVAVNRFPHDSEADVASLLKAAKELGPPAFVSTVYEKGSPGGVEGARIVTELCDKPSEFRHLYGLELPVVEKICTIATELYGANGVALSKAAEEDAEMINALGFSNLPVCVAKTPRSITDDPNLTGAPTGFNLNVRGLHVAAGAGFIIALCSKVLLMPGLPKRPNAETIDTDAYGNVTGI